jgi:hypothetical protein
LSNHFTRAGWSGRERSTGSAKVALAALRALAGERIDAQDLDGLLAARRGLGDKLDPRAVGDGALAVVAQHVRMQEDIGAARRRRQRIRTPSSDRTT